MYVRPSGLRQRYRGHTEEGSWAAHVSARFGATVVLALLLSSCVAVAVAGAASRGRAGDPAPQKAPIAAPPAQPSPDPAPQAKVRSAVSHTSIPKTPVLRVPTVTSPVTTRSAPATQPRLVHSGTSTLANAGSPTGSRARTQLGHPVSHRHAAARPPKARPAPATRRTPSRITLAFPKDLLQLPRAALHAGSDSRGGGALLVLSSLAMGVLAIASVALLRRLRRLELR